MKSIIRPLLVGNNAWMKIVFSRVRAFWARCCFPLMTAVALIWFLVRVVPKPGRASYPCQRAAFPLASACVIWLLGLKASMVTGLKAGLLLRKVRVVLAGITVVFAFSLIAWGIGLKQATAGLSTDGPNSPIGTGKGLYPGRVAWIYDPTAALWNSAGNWWADSFNNQAAIDQMVSKTIRCVSGQNTDAAAWDCLFHSFNKRTGKGDVGYAPGEKIAIKINENNTSSHADSTEINASPHLVLALLKELINQAGLVQSNITVFDASRFITDNLYNKCHGQFPGVVFVDNIGGGGRVKTTYQTNAILYSVNCNLAKGLATCVVQANYVIDMAVLKGHVGQGITLCGKNFYGSTSIASDWTKNSHDYFSPKSDGSPTYVAFADFLGHKDLGGKTLLFMIDALYGCKVVNGPPGPKWNLSPFSGRWPSSLFVSEDGVAVDSVALDFFRSEWATAGDLNYCDTYLHEAALANNPPSHTFYDPERDGIRCPSLGVHEHWNNASNKAYSRNLGKNTGIELVALHSVAGVSIAITNPSASSVLVAGSAVPLASSLATTYSTVRQVAYYSNGGILGISTNSPFDLIWTNAPAGTWALRAVATTTDNLTATSAVVTVTVVAAPGLTGTWQSNNAFQLSFQNPGLTCSLLASTNLTSWTTLSDFAAQTGNLQFLDQNATNWPRRFYRLRFD